MMRAIWARLVCGLYVLRVSVSYIFFFIFLVWLAWYLTCLVCCLTCGIVRGFMGNCSEAC